MKQIGLGMHLRADKNAKRGDNFFRSPQCNWDWYIKGQFHRYKSGTNVTYCQLAWSFLLEILPGMEGGNIYNQLLPMQTVDTKAPPNDSQCCILSSNRYRYRLDEGLNNGPTGDASGLLIPATLTQLGDGSGKQRIVLTEAFQRLVR